MIIHYLHGPSPTINRAVLCIHQIDTRLTRTSPGQGSDMQKPRQALGRAILAAFVLLSGYSAATATASPTTQPAPSTSLAGMTLVSTAVPRLLVLSDPSGGRLDATSATQAEQLNRYLGSISAEDEGRRVLARFGGEVIVADAHDANGVATFSVSRYDEERAGVLGRMVSKTSVEAVRVGDLYKYRTSLDGGTWGNFSLPRAAPQGTGPVGSIVCGAVTGAASGVACALIPVAGLIFAGVCGAVGSAAGTAACLLVNTGPGGPSLQSCAVPGFSTLQYNFSLFNKNYVNLSYTTGYSIDPHNGYTLYNYYNNATLHNDASAVIFGWQVIDNRPFGSIIGQGGYVPIDTAGWGTETRSVCVFSVADAGSSGNKYGSYGPFDVK